MMNRQIRRAQAKQDKKAERDKQERRDARKRKVAELRSKRAERRAAIRAAPKEGTAKDGAKEGAGAAAAKPGGKRGRAPGRFSGALMMATVFFIVLQSSIPPEEGGNEVLRLVTGAGFYLLFGYFSVMWLMRRTTPRPLMMTWITGALLIVGVEVAKAIQGVVPFDPVLVALSLPAVVGGSYLGRLVYENTPA
jgi:hypothetical protein